MTQRTPEEASAFETLSDRYDAWYDSPAGRVLFDCELAALRPLLDGTGQPRLEVGVGTGRFATALEIEVSVDVEFAPLAFARGRGVRVAQGTGEQLPFPDGTFDAVVLIATLCFVQRPDVVVSEARRVLRPGGRLIVAFVPRDSPWGLRYQAMGRDGNPFYRDAVFSTVDEITQLLERSGVTVVARRSTLFQPPSPEPYAEDARGGSSDDAGFVVLACVVSESTSV